VIVLSPEALFANSTANRSGIAVLVDGMSHLREIVGEHFEIAPSGRGQWMNPWQG
jgi:hypothetical protein